MKRYLYILGNKSFKDNVFKIGLTTKSPEDRAKQLSSLTAVPLPYDVLYQREVDDAPNLEALVHFKLGKYRISKDREFFKVSIDQIIQTIEESLTARISTQVDRKYFSSDYKNSGLLKIWHQVGQKPEATKSLEKQLPFCEAIVDRILSLSPDVSIRIAPKVIQFDDGLLGLFCGIVPKMKKIVVAPLRLNPESLKAHGCPFRDISQKKYSMGGKVRVDLFNGDQNDLDLAYSLAELSFKSNEKIVTWNIFGIRK